MTYLRIASNPLPSAFPSTEYAIYSRNKNNKCMNYIVTDRTKLQIKQTQKIYKEEEKAKQNLCVCVCDERIVVTSFDFCFDLFVAIIEIDFGVWFTCQQKTHSFVSFICSLIHSISHNLAQLLTFVSLGRD
jgi:hypothetical protein